MIKSTKSSNFWFMVLPTAGFFYVALFLTIKLRYPVGLTQTKLLVHLQAFTIIYFFWLLVFFSHNLFDFTILRRYTTLFFSLVSAMIINLLIAIIYFYFQPALILTPRRFLLVDISLTFLLVLFWNLIVKWFIFGRLTQSVYLFSFNNQLENLAEEIEKHSYLGFRVMGHINQEQLKNLSTKFGTIVIFPDNLHNNPSLASNIFSLRNQGIKFYNHNTFYEQLLRRVYLDSLHEIWFLENISYSKKVFFNLIKSIFDLLIGIILLILFVISFPIFGVLIKLTSNGPIIFKQKRVGKNGQIFTIYKYRTMMGTDKRAWTNLNDPRITFLGKLMRLMRMDELPQSINLLLGHMSVVGPRPEQVPIVEELVQAIPFYEERHLVKPGLTGWAQLNIYAASLEESKIKLSYDLYYIKNRSILLDLEILIKTIYYIFTGQGR
jgi:lipopolysaccharide/colanic/teichoic acid biosynthesis glycosyltransferase